MEVSSEVAILPIQLLGKCSLEAKNFEMDDLALIGLSTLEEIAKGIFNHPHIMSLKIDTVLTALILKLEEISKLTFTQDKSTPIDLLTHPFRQMKNSLEEEPVKNHPHTPFVQQELDRVLGEFQELKLSEKPSKYSWI